MKTKTEAKIYYAFTTKNNKYLNLNYELVDYSHAILNFEEVNNPADSWQYSSFQDLKEDYLIFLSSERKSELFDEEFTFYYNHNNVEITGYEKIFETHVINIETQSHDLNYFKEDKK